MQEVEQFKAKPPLPSFTSSTAPVNHHRYIYWPANTRVQRCKKEHGFTRQKTRRASKEDWVCTPATQIWMNYFQLDLVMILWMYFWGGTPCMPNVRTERLTVIELQTAE